MLVGWGELLWDVFPTGPRLGGAPANVVYHAARLGEPSALVSRVGNDPRGDEAIRLMATHGVDVSAVSRDLEAPTGSVNVTLRDGEPRFVCRADPTRDRIELNDAAAALLRRARVLVFGTLAQRTPAARATLARAAALVPADCIRLCDLNLRGDFRDGLTAADAMIAAATVVKVNEAEVGVLSRHFAVDDLPAWLCATRGVDLVAITRGNNGCVLVRAGERVESPGVSVDTSRGDAVGAGDAFAATLGVLLARGASLEHVGVAANTYAAHVAAAAGAMADVGADVIRKITEVGDG